MMFQPQQHLRARIPPVQEYVMAVSIRGLMNRSIAGVLAVGLAILLTFEASGADDVLAGTERLTLDQPVDAVMIEGLRRFCLRELAGSPAVRTKLWQPHLVNPATFSARATAARQRLRVILGAVDRRLTVAPVEAAAFELMTTLDQSSVVARTAFVTVHRVRWPVIDGVTAEGLLLVPQSVRAGVVALPDADWTPEMFCGLAAGVPESVQFAGRLAEAGCMVAVPMLISRSDEFSGHPNVTFTNQPHREFLYRQAFEVGRHVIGFEVLKTLAAVDLLERHLQRLPPNPANGPARIGVAGIGEGGLLALHSAALDPRIQSCWVSGYFQQREGIWQEPIYRNVWGLLTEFGDAELAGLIAPRNLVIEAAQTVKVPGPPAARKGRATVAAPGQITTCNPDSVRAEAERARTFFRVFDAEGQLTLVVTGDRGDGAPGSLAAIESFAAGLGLTRSFTGPVESWQTENKQQTERPTASELALAREKRQFDELQAHVQNLMLKSHQIRNDRWRLDPTAIEVWKQRQPDLRTWVHEELIGRLPHARLPLRPRSRKVLETAGYVGYEVVLDVFDDVIAAGVLLIPTGLQEGERRTTVVCQHGLEGTPFDTISREPRAWSTYKAFSEQLVLQGYVVYAPQNPYRGGDQFRALQRMSNPLQRSLFSCIIAQHEQTLDWLSSLPFVDPQRIAFYGISYGGKTAMRVPPMVPGYGLAICSGDFTDWPRTLVSGNERFSYLFTSEYEVFEWNLAHVASYAELAMLMSPRPFMVEEGHRDGGQPSEWVAGEFGKVRRHYDQLGISDRAVLEFFDGPHTIHGEGTFRFLKRFADGEGGAKGTADR
jgi:dienelactone hydrolase